MKVKTKLLIMLVVTLLAILFIGTTKVNATTEVTEETVQELIKILPNNIQLNIKESEYENAFNVILSEVEKSLNDNNIQYTVNNDIDGIPHNSEIILQGKFEGILIPVNDISFHSVEDIKKYELYLYYNEQNVITSEWHKEIELEYSNSKNYNSTDEKAVKDLKIEGPHYYEVDITSKNLHNWSIVNLTAEEYYNSLVNDSSISIKARIGGGDIEGFNFSFSGIYIAIFKNDILYDVRRIKDEYTVPVITVPNTVSDTELNNYVTEILMRYYSNSTQWPSLKSIISIAKGAIIDWTYNNQVEWSGPIKDGYTVKADFEYFGECESYIIIRREAVQSSVNVTDKDTNVKLESSTDIVPADTQLVVDKLTTGNVYSIVEKALGTETSKFVLYDITLKQNNKDIQPNGKVKISIPIPEGYDTSRIAVYRIAEDGTKTEYAITINNGYITFETDHFSNYVVAEKEVNKGQLDDTPKTGAIDIIYYVLPIAIISATGIIVLKRKETK